MRTSRSLRIHKRWIDGVERRLGELEDRADIAALLARYGPAVDSLNGAVLSKLWTSSGSYTFDETRLEADELRGLVDLGSHRQLVERGCGHLLTSPSITITGDTAVAVNHSLVLLHADDGWRAVRLSANRWELRRTSDGWRVHARTAQLLDGRSTARELLAEGRPTL